MNESVVNPQDDRPRELVAQELILRHVQQRIERLGMTPPSDDGTGIFYRRNGVPLFAGTVYGSKSSATVGFYNLLTNWVYYNVPYAQMRNRPNEEQGLINDALNLLRTNKKFRSAVREELANQGILWTSPVLVAQGERTQIAPVIIGN